MTNDDKFDLILSRLDTIQTAVISLQQTVGTLQSDVGTLKSDVAELKSDVQTLNTRVSNLESDMVEVKTWLGKLDKRVERLEVSAKQAKSERKTLYNICVTIDREAREFRTEMQKFQVETDKHFKILEHRLHGQQLEVSLLALRADRAEERLDAISPEAA